MRETGHPGANMNRSREKSALLCAAILSGISAASVAGAQVAPNTGADIAFHVFVPNASAARGATAVSLTDQIASLEQDKQLRTPAQQKIDSNILYTMRMMRGDAAVSGVPVLDTGVELDQRDRFAVDITANVTDALLKKLQAAGATVIYANADFHAIRAVVPAQQIENIAASDDVSFIARRVKAMTHRPRAATPVYPDWSASFGTGEGSVDSEGDITHRAYDARGTYATTGSGVKIGVLSDSANNTGAATAAQASGDLPPSCGGAASPCLKVLQDDPSGNSSDEGTAMLEIVHDLAPGANLDFATAQGGEANFAQNVINLKNDGCKIIVDDVFYFDESPFQDGIVAQAVNTVTAAGVLYFSSAGNEGNVDAGTAGVFEGDFNDAGSASFLFPGGAKSGTIHNFGTMASPVNGDIITGIGEMYTLNWADPIGASNNDYDLFLVSSTGTVKASSTNIQNGTQNAYEQISPPNLASGDRLVVFKTASASPRYFALNTLRGTLTVATAGQTHGHSAASAAFSVAATPAVAPGPFPGSFGPTDSVEPFSSDGPRRIFFNANGTAITPGNFTSTGGAVRNKPDITAADGVTTTLPSDSGLNPFYGTSAAAPHAAAIAGLMLSAKPTLTAAQVRTALTGTTFDIMNSGNDRDSGAGIVMGYQAVASLGVPGTANPELVSVTATERRGTGNGDGVIEPGETAVMTIKLSNVSGVQDATGVSATLSTTSPGVTITQATSAYPNMAKGTGSATNTTAFGFTLSPGAACALDIQFKLHVTFTGGARDLAFDVQSGVYTFNGTLGSTPPAIPGFVTATGTQTDRLFRDSSPAACGTTKAFPGTVAAGSLQFDSYTFTAARSICLDAVLTSANGNNLFESIYSPSFDPSDILTNYLGDPGTSFTSRTCSVSVAAGTPYTIVVNDVSGSNGGTHYTLSVPSCVLGTVDELFADGYE